VIWLRSLPSTNRFIGRLRSRCPFHYRQRYRFHTASVGSRQPYDCVGWSAVVAGDSGVAVAFDAYRHTDLKT